MRAGLGPDWRLYPIGRAGTGSRRPRSVSLVAFARAEGRWLGAGLLLTFCSSAGQTFFISLFGAEIRAAHGLGHGGFGLVYMLATLASAAALVALGRVVDGHPPARVVTGTLVALGLACALMAASRHVATLALALFGLRLFGQGMLSHVAMTLTGRWFVASRGRAVSIAALGHQLGEAVLPLGAVALLGLVGWRAAWLVVGAALVVLALPLARTLLTREREPSGTERESLDAVRHWTRAEVLRDPLFLVVLPAVLSPAFIGTSVFFHQVHLTEIKGWPLEAVASAFALMAATTVACALATGRAIDRFGAARLLPGSLLALAAGCLVLWRVDALWGAYAFMTLLGVSQGITLSLFGALWPELYGTRHLGAIRAVTFAAMVFGTALGPGVTGALIDGGVGFESQLGAMAGWCLLATGALGLVAPRLVRRSRAERAAIASTAMRAAGSA